ncbi:MAG: DUF4404 family protein [bacterium]
MAPQKQLRESIEHLREELASGAPLGREDRALLESVLDRVSDVAEAEAPEHHSFAEEFFEDLREMGDRFEESHPRVALVVGRIADALSQLGI